MEKILFLKNLFISNRVEVCLYHKNMWLETRLGVLGQKVDRSTASYARLGLDKNWSPFQGLDGSILGL